MSEKAISFNRIEHIRRLFACGVTVENVADKVDELVDVMNRHIGVQEIIINHIITELEEDK